MEIYQKLWENFLNEKRNEDYISKYKKEIDGVINYWKKNGWGRGKKDDNGNGIYDVIYDRLNKSYPDGWLMPHDDPEYDEKIDIVDGRFHRQLRKYLSQNF